MSAFVCALRPTFVDVLSDAAMFDPGGAIQAIRAKIIAIPGGVVTAAVRWPCWASSPCWRAVARPSTRSLSARRKCGRTPSAGQPNW